VRHKIELADNLGKIGVSFTDGSRCANNIGPRNFQQIRPHPPHSSLSWASAGILPTLLAPLPCDAHCRPAGHLNTFVPRNSDINHHANASDCKGRVTPRDKISFEVSEIITLPNGRLLVTLIRAAVCLFRSVSHTHVPTLSFERHAKSRHEIEVNLF